MNSFVRFIFLLLIMGVLVNLAVVFAANAHSQHRQTIQDAKDRDDLEEVLAKADQTLRHVDAIVESQRFDQDNNATETTLLLRQYHSPGTDQTVANSVQRIIIPGDRLAIYGAILHFSGDFAADAPEFQIVRNKTLVYFTYACGEDEKPNPNLPDDRFTFMPQWETPELTRLNIYTLRSTIFEVRLWKYIWNRLPDEQHPLPWNSGWKNGINATYIAPVVVTGVRPGVIYSATVSASGEHGTIFWDMEKNNLPRVHDIITQRRRQEAATQPATQPSDDPATRP